jgi:hypothetical protein
MSLRYVILHHRLGEDAHWDLMLEQAHALATWQCGRNPLELTPGETMAVTPLPAHRKTYLDYEGPVSNNRGRVVQIAAGVVESLDRDGRAIRFTLVGPLSGSFCITTGESADACMLTRET